LHKFENILHLKIFNWKLAQFDQIMRTKQNKFNYLKQFELNQN